MTTTRTTLMALALLTLTTFGAAGIANARGHYGQDMHNGSYNTALTSEQQATMQKAYDTVYPLRQQLYAKRAELNAQIAAGADDKTLKGLVGEVNALSAKLVETQASMQQQMVKSGIPAGSNAMNCPNGGMMSDNSGWHNGGMRHGGMNYGGMRHGRDMQYGNGMRHNGGMHGNW